MNPDNPLNLRTVNGIASDLGVPFWRVRHAITRSCGRIRPSMVLGKVHYYNPEMQKTIIDEIASVKANVSNRPLPV